MVDRDIGSGQPPQERERQVRDALLPVVRRQRRMAEHDRGEPGEFADISGVTSGGIPQHQPSAPSDQVDRLPEVGRVPEPGRLGESLDGRVEIVGHARKGQRLDVRVVAPA